MTLLPCLDSLPAMPDTSEESLPDLHGKHLIIASPLAISEAVFSAPAVRSLRDPIGDGLITILASSETAPLWRSLVEVDEVIECQLSDSTRQIARSLRRSSGFFNLSLAWDDSPATRAFAKVGIPERIGFSEDKTAKSLTRTIKVQREPGPIEHRVKDYLDIAQKLGADPYLPTHFAPPERPLSQKTSTVIFSPGSDFGPAAEWPVERFQELARQISRDHEIKILPAPNRPGPANSLARLLGVSVINYSGDQLLQFLASAHFLVASDSSVPHLASFVGTPSLVIFGPNQPDWHRPLGKIHQVVHQHVACSGCLLNKCPLDHRCMEELTLDRVLDAYNRLSRS